MVLEGLGKSLRDVIAHIGSSSVVDEELVREISKELQRALLQADVNVQLVLEITNRIQDRALNEKPPAGKSSKDHVIGIIHKEMVSLLDNGGGLALKPQTIMMVGLYGQGKTTTTGKLALFLSKKGFSVGLIGADVYRPGALDQLQQLGAKINVEVYGEPGNKNAAEIVKNGKAKFSDKKIVIVDTSGRHALEEDLIQELKDIAAVSKPDERVLVLDAQVGQQAGPQADAFNKAVGVTGVILTKLDGTAKGGGALSAVARTNARIIFIGTGEHIRDLESFNADRFISRLLGMGDLAALVQ
ncbi:MAG: signal recognition particle receptor subunit alpha, partial [Candidatus Methanoplasma sp.]|nr:signal recognition particle receptor subunit alpha [Candidatus Methanoplasma sp.]